MKELTDEQLNIAICEWRGWKWDGSYWTLNGDINTRMLRDEHLPQNITGIKALGNMHEAEKGLNGDTWNKYWFALVEVVDLKVNTVSDLRRMISATARQRAIALLRVVKPELFI